MKTKQLMLAGSRYQNKCCKGGSLLSSALLLFTTITAQSVSFCFSFEEQVQTRYASLFNTTGMDSVIRGYNRMAGSFQWDRVNDSISRMSIRTEQYHSDFASLQADSSIFDFYIVNDKKGDFLGLHIRPAFLPALQTHLSWILEWNAATNDPQHRNGYSRIDGTIQYQTTIANKESGWILQRSNPLLQTRSGGNLQIVFDQFEWESAFEKGNLLPNSLQINESFRQFVGRKQLACVNKRLTIEKTMEPTWRYAADIPDFYFNPVQIANAKERQKQIDENLLKGFDGTKLLTALAEVNEKDAETMFRLGAKFRAFASQQGTKFFFDSLLYQLPLGGLKREMIENALMQSTASFAPEILIRRIDACAQNYDCLRDFLIRLSLYCDPVEPLFESLKRLLAIESENLRSLVLLTQSNLLLKVKAANPSLYSKWLPIVLDELEWRNASVDDSLFNFRVLGNTGTESMFRFLKKIYEKRPELREEIVFNLRHMRSEAVDSLLENYVLVESPDENSLTEILMERKISIALQNNFIKRILDADAKSDTSQVAMMRLLLDRRWQDRIDISRLVSHSFTTNVYKEEWESYKKGLMHCDR